MHRRIHTYYYAYARYVAASVALLSFLHLSLHEHPHRVVGHRSSPCSLALVPYAFSMLPSGVPTILTMPDVMLLAIPCYLVSSSMLRHNLPLAITVVRLLWSGDSGVIGAFPLLASSSQGDHHQSNHVRKNGILSFSVSLPSSFSFILLPCPSS